MERRHEMGPEGRCICPKCGEKMEHQRGVPCQDQTCPRCGAKLLREGSYHHDKLKEQTGRKTGL